MKEEENGKYVGDAVYGALDGIVTTFAIVAGVTGASFSASIVLVLGIANLIADGISMAAGNYLSKRSEQDYRKKMRLEERLDVDRNPEKHKMHVEEIYREKGFSGKLLSSIVKTITRDKEKWVDEMMIGELGIYQEKISPLKAGITTFIAFVLAGVIPLVSYVLAFAVPGIQSYSFVAACVLTGITLFVVGGLRSLIIAKSWWRAGMEMLIIGGIAAGAAFLIGHILSGFV